ncbi:hypothetical protein GALMADRAFT_1328519 [Galerina marginata CBS 339.88]|uniref:Uncharacterized protein n=1 Tax=Galerina marginata (strain CBS 339.88) TaxID=685588 RepID=A0A067T0C3_GALM3|nr:hypothetical protein GALMADRAFT_1328519 [Galerina marginata CBS 339.88]
MEQVLTQPQPNENANPSRAVLLSPLLLIRSFEGLPAQPIEEQLPRRRNATADPETSTAIPLQQLNVVEPTSHEEAAARLARAQKELIVILTVNRLCRIITIVVLGLWGGWSIMPAETKAPAIPESMDWYFRKWPEWGILAKKDRPRVSVTGYSILNTLIGLGIAFFNCTGLVAWGKTRKSQAFGFFTLIMVPIYLMTHMLPVVRKVYALATWWWIAFRIHGIVNILRSRDRPEMAVQFRILTAGLAVEFVLLFWFFSIPFFPYLFGRGHWNSRLWLEHFPPLLARLGSWVLVVVFGLWIDLPNIFYPCSGKHLLHTLIEAVRKLGLPT